MAPKSGGEVGECLSRGGGMGRELWARCPRPLSQHLLSQDPWGPLRITSGKPRSGQASEGTTG